eukprot:8649313-Pyramimonas_sp.AAC.1
MRRPSRSPNSKRTPWVWSHGDGRGHCADPNAAPYLEQLTEKDYGPATAEEIFNREWHAGKPADHKPEERSQQESGEDKDDEMAEEVGPTDAAHEGYTSSYSGDADVTCQTDTTIDPDYI